MPSVEEFSRRQKFLLGDRLQATTLDVLERLVEATYTRDRRRHLAAANPGIEKLRVPVPFGEGPQLPGRAPVRACGARSRRDGVADRRLAEGG